MEDFVGDFTLEWRERFLAKRRELSLTYEQLGHFFRLNWSTIRKWEAGITARCQLKHIHLVQSFLAGEFDSQLRKAYQTPATVLENWSRLPACVHQCMERITNTYNMCEGHPALRNGMLDSIAAATRQTLTKLLADGA